MKRTALHPPKDVSSILDSVRRVCRITLPMVLVTLVTAAGIAVFFEFVSLLLLLQA